MIYLDNAATTRPLNEVIRAMRECMEGLYFNPSSAYAPAMAAQKALRAARKTLQIAAGDMECVFTSGATESNNMAIFGALRGRFAKAVTTAGEHPSVLEAHKEAAKRNGHALAIIPLQTDGSLDRERLQAELTPDVRLISLQWVNNETGFVHPIAEIARLRDALCPEALLHVDGVQGFLRLPADFAGVDMLALSAHKVQGPKGVGALLLSKKARVLPLLYGGGQEGNLRSGTENMPGILGFAEAVRRFKPEWPGDIRALKSAFLGALRGLRADVHINGPAPEDAAPHIVNFSIPGINGEVLLRALEAKGILVSTGSACSAHKKGSHVLAAMNIQKKYRESALRISLSPLNTAAEMGEAARALSACADELLPYRRR